MNARPEYYIQAETDYRMTQGNTVNAQTGIPVPGGDFRITENDNNRVTQQTGFDVAAMFVDALEAAVAAP
jgi:hypothetical protein